MGLCWDNLVGSNTSRAWAIPLEGDAERCCCSAMMWDFGHHGGFCAACLESRAVLDVRDLCIEDGCARSAFFQSGLVDRMDRPDSGFGSYRLSAFRGGIDSFYC